MPANITRIYIVYFCTRFHLYIHAYALLLRSRGLNLLEIATIESVVIGTMFAMEVPTGVLADRLGRKWSIVASTGLLMLAELLFLFSRDYALYLLVGVLTGTGFAFASGAVEALIYDSLPPDEDRDDAMKRAMGRYGAIGQIAFFLSPVAGGLLLSDLAPERFDLAIALTVGVLLIGTLVSLTLKEPPTDWTTERESALSILRAGVREIRGNRRLQRIVLLAVLLSAFTGTLITTLAPPYLVQNDVDPFAVGLALSIGSLFAAVTQANAHRVERWLGPRAGLTTLALLPGAGYLLLALVTGPAATWLVIVWLYATNDMKAPLFSAYQNALIPAGSRATTLSLINMAVSLWLALAAPVYAAIATGSLPLAFGLMGGVILLAGVLLRVDRLASARPATAID